MIQNHVINLSYIFIWCFRQITFAIPFVFVHNTMFNEEQSLQFAEIFETTCTWGKLSKPRVKNRMQIKRKMKNQIEFTLPLTMSIIPTMSKKKLCRSALDPRKVSSVYRREGWRWWWWWLWWWWWWWVWGHDEVWGWRQRRWFLYTTFNWEIIE